MTAFRHLRRHPMPIVRHRFPTKGIPARFVTDFGPAFTGDTFREELRNVVARYDEPAGSNASTKPRSH